jgi:hypothetical protein
MSLVMVFEVNSQDFEFVSVSLLRCFQASCFHSLGQYSDWEAFNFYSRCQDLAVTSMSFLSG